MGKQMLITRSVKDIYNVKHKNCTVREGETPLESKALASALVFKLTELEGLIQ